MHSKYILIRRMSNTLAWVSSLFIFISISKEHIEFKNNKNKRQEPPTNYGALGREIIMVGEGAARGGNNFQVMWEKLTGQKYLSGAPNTSQTTLSVAWIFTNFIIWFHKLGRVD